MSFIQNNADEFYDIVDNFHEGLIVISNSRDKLLDTNSSAERIFHAGLGNMNKMTDADLVKKKFQRVEIKQAREPGTDNQNDSDVSSDLGEEDSHPNPKVSLVEIVDSLERGRKPGTFISKDIYRVCLPKVSRVGT